MFATELTIYFEFFSCEHEYLVFITSRKGKSRPFAIDPTSFGLGSYTPDFSTLLGYFKRGGGMFFPKKGNFFFGGSRRQTIIFAVSRIHLRRGSTLENLEHISIQH